MAEGRRFCENCGAGIGETTNFCPSCGAAQKPNPEVPGGPPPTTPQAGTINTPEVPGVPPPPRAGSRSWGKIALGSCGGLVLLLVLLVGCVALLGGGGGEEGDSAQDSEPKEKEKDKGKGSPSQQEAAPVSIGEPATAGDVQWTVTSAERVGELVREGPTPKLTKTEQGSFVTVDLDFTNNGSDPVTLVNNSLRLLDSEGRESNPKSDALTYIPEDRRILLEGVNPGITRQGRVIFEVPPDASGFQLEAGDTQAFGEEAYVDLGF